MCKSKYDDEMSMSTPMVPTMEPKQKTFQISMIENGFMVTEYNYSEKRYAFPDFAEMLNFLVAEYQLKFTREDLSKFYAVFAGDRIK